MKNEPLHFYALGGFDPPTADTEPNADHHTRESREHARNVLRAQEWARENEARKRRQAMYGDAVTEASPEPVVSPASLLTRVRRRVRAWWTRPRSSEQTSKEWMAIFVLAVIVSGFVWGVVHG